MKTAKTLGLTMQDLLFRADNLLIEGYEVRGIV